MQGQTESSQLENLKKTLRPLNHDFTTDPAGPLSVEPLELGPLVVDFYFVWFYTTLDWATAGGNFNPAEFPTDLA